MKDKFYPGLLLIAVITYGIGVVFSTTIAQQPLYIEGVVVVLYFILLSSAVHAGVMRTLSKSPNRFVNAVMISISAKLIVTSLVLVIYLFILRSEGKNTAILAMIGYLTFTTYTTWQLFRTLKTLNSSKK